MPDNVRRRYSVDQAAENGPSLTGGRLNFQRGGFAAIDGLGAGRPFLQGTPEVLRTLRARAATNGRDFGAGWREQGHSTWPARSAASRSACMAMGSGSF